MTGPVRPAPCACVHELRVGFDRGRPPGPSRAPPRRPASGASFSPIGIARHRAHDERRRIAALAVDRQRDGHGLAAEHAEHLADHRPQHLAEIDDGADRAPDLVNRHQLPHARREPLLVLLEAPGHDPERLGDVADLVVGVDRDTGVEIPARHGQRPRVQVLQRPAHAPREQVRQQDRERERRERAGEQGRDRPAAGDRERLAIDGDAEQTHRFGVDVLELPEGDRVGVAVDLQRHHGGAGAQARHLQIGRHVRSHQTCARRRHERRGVGVAAHVDHHLASGAECRFEAVDDGTVDRDGDHRGAQQSQRRIGERQRRPDHQAIAGALDAHRAFVGERPQDDGRAIHRLEPGPPGGRGLVAGAPRAVGDDAPRRVGGLVERVRHRQRQLAEPLPGGLRGSGLGPQQGRIVAERGRPGRELLHLLQEQTARHLQAAHRLEFDALLDAREDEQHGDHRNRDDRTQRRDDERRRQPPAQAVPTQRRGRRGQRPGAGPAPQPLPGR